MVLYKQFILFINEDISNFLTQDSVRKEDKTNYDTLMKSISWFFFDLLFLGYVEDLHSGESFHLPGGLSWSIYIEVSVHRNGTSFLTMCGLGLFLFLLGSATNSV